MPSNNFKLALEFFNFTSFFELIIFSRVNPNYVCLHGFHSCEFHLFRCCLSNLNYCFELCGACNYSLVRGQLVCNYRYHYKAPTEFCTYNTWDSYRFGNLLAKEINYSSTLACKCPSFTVFALPPRARWLISYTRCDFYCAGNYIVLVYK